MERLDDPLSQHVCEFFVAGARINRNDLEELVSRWRDALSTAVGSDRNAQRVVAIDKRLKGGLKNCYVKGAFYVDDVGEVV